MENEMKYIIKEFEPADEIIYNLKKQVNRLILEKVELMGILDSAIEEIPYVKKRNDLRQRVASNKFIKPVGWCDELPYPEVELPSAPKTQKP